MLALRPTNLKKLAWNGTESHLPGDFIDVRFLGNVTISSTIMLLRLYLGDAQWQQSRTATEALILIATTAPVHTEAASLQPCYNPPDVVILGR
jgi:hypothetical protein